MSTVVYGSEELALTDMPKTAGLRRADTIEGQVLAGWQTRRQMASLITSQYLMDRADLAVAQAQ
jgi:hypothetical protein